MEPVCQLDRVAGFLNNQITQIEAQFKFVKIDT
jgi:hypothetical protein